jgi:hypothetical protein
MDILTHAALGWAVSPSPECVAGSILPDVALLGHRRGQSPPLAYRWTHSILFAAAIAPLSPQAALGILTHIALDIPTHGVKFATQPFYPLAGWHLATATEWEFWNRTWITAALLVALALTYRTIFLS